jgi:flagellar basal-body rod protein FlgC
VLETISFGDALSRADGQPPGGVHVAQVVEDPNPGRKVYSPGHPDADADGFVTLPNVNPIHEVVNLMTASKAYEANATAVETLKSMAQRALDVAR